MKLIRPLHLLIALLVPALSAVCTGLLIRLVSQNLATRVNAISRVVGFLGPNLAGLSIHCKNAHLLQQPRPAVFIFNHQSGLDPVIVCSLVKKNVVGIAKPALAKNPVLGPLLKLTGTLFVDKGHGQKGTLPREDLLNVAVQRMHQGFSIAVAPEGTRINKQAVGSFKLGAFHIAQRSGYPLIPLVIHNSGERLAPKSSQLIPGSVRVTVLEPMYISAEQDITEVAQQMEQRYEDCLLASR